jgi:hypothetical protein
MTGKALQKGTFQGLFYWLTDMEYGWDPGMAKQLLSSSPAGRMGVETLAGLVRGELARFWEGLLTVLEAVLRSKRRLTARQTRQVCDGEEHA